MTSAIEDRSRDRLAPSTPLKRATPGLALLWLIMAWAASSFAGNPAVASVESQLAYHRGVVAFGEGNLDQAKQQFESMLSEDPDDASVLQYLGIIASKQNDPDLAIDFFRRAVQADPEDAEIRFTLGVALLHRDRADEARQEFDRVLAVEPDNAQAEFYAGVADYRRQNYPETVRHMRAALSIDPSLRLRARYYVGLAEVFMGNLEASTAAFADAASLSPSDPLAISADMLGKMIQPEARPWGLDVSSGFEFDSNPTFVGSDVLIVNENNQVFEPKREADVLGIFTINTYYDIVDWQQITMRLGYSGFLSIHDRAGAVDQFTHLFWTDLAWSQGDLRFGLRFDLSTTDLNLDDDYQEMRRLSPSLTYTHGVRGVTQLLYQFYDFEYRFSNGDLPDFDPDGQLHSIGISHFVYLPAPFTFARAGVAYEHSKTQGTEFDYDGVVLSTGAGMELPYAMRLGLLVQYIHRQYAHRTIVGQLFGSGENSKRRDDIGTLKLDLTIPMAQYWEFALRGSLSFNDSNIKDYDYNRHVVGSYFTFTF